MTRIISAEDKQRLYDAAERRKQQTVGKPIERKPNTAQAIIRGARLRDRAVAGPRGLTMTNKIDDEIGNMCAPIVKANSAYTFVTSTTSYSAAFRIKLHVICH